MALLDLFGLPRGRLGQPVIEKNPRDALRTFAFNEDRQVAKLERAVQAKLRGRSEARTQLVFMPPHYDVLSSRVPIRVASLSEGSKLVGTKIGFGTGFDKEIKDAQGLENALNSLFSTMNIPIMEANRWRLRLD